MLRVCIAVVCHGHGHACQVLCLCSVCSHVDFKYDIIFEVNRLTDDKLAFHFCGCTMLDRNAARCLSIWEPARVPWCTARASGLGA
jgi:hypothetical protein